MKRRIWDLLDNIREDAIDLGASAPLSPERIKALTMDQIEQNDHAERKEMRTLKGVIGKVLIAAILVCSLAVTASAAEYSDAPRAHGQILDKNGNVLKDVPLIKQTETVRGSTVVTDIILSDDGGYAYQGDDIVTDIVLLDDCRYLYINEDARWREQFHVLMPEQQTKISFRPDTASGEAGNGISRETTAGQRP